MKSTPVGVAQRMVLDALGLSASDWNDANRKFENVGITVSSRRVGKSSEPVVSVMEDFAGGWNDGGDGAAYERNFNEVDLTPIRQWIK